MLGGAYLFGVFVSVHVCGVCVCACVCACILFALQHLIFDYRNAS